MSCISNALQSRDRPFVFRPGVVNGSLAEAAVNDTCPLVVAEVKEKAVGDDKVHPVAEDVFDLKAQGNEPTVPMTIPPKITSKESFYCCQAAVFRAN